MSQLARITVERRDGVPVASISGQIDLSNRHEVGERLTREIGNVDHGAVIDLSGVDYIDSAGITLLFTLAESLRDRQQRLRLVVPADARIRRVLTLVAIGSVAAIDEAVDDAAAAVRALGG